MCLTQLHRFSAPSEPTKLDDLCLAGLQLSRRANFLYGFCGASARGGESTWDPELIPNGLECRHLGSRLWGSSVCAPSCARAAEAISRACSPAQMGLAATFCARFTCFGSSSRPCLSLPRPPSTTTSCRPSWPLKARRHHPRNQTCHASRSRWMRT